MSDQEQNPFNEDEHSQAGHDHSKCQSVLFAEVQHTCGHKVSYTKSQLDDTGTPEYLSKFPCADCEEHNDKEEEQPRAEHKAGCQCLNCRTPEQNDPIELAMNQLVDPFIESLAAKYEGQPELALECMAKLVAKYCIKFDMSPSALTGFSEVLLSVVLSRAKATLMSRGLKL